MSVINKIQKGTTVYDIQDSKAIANPENPKNGQILTYNGTSWVAQDAPSSGVQGVTAADNSITIGGTSTNPTVGAKISTVENNGLSVKTDGLYAAATDLSGVEGRLTTIEGKESGWDSKLDASDITTGNSNGNISVDGTDVAVKGLGSAAYTESSAYLGATAQATDSAKLNGQAASYYATDSDMTSAEGRLDTIEGKIPTAATSTNQLADKDFVNSSVSTNTANYISNSGNPFDSVDALKAYTGTVTNNDYAFVTGTDSAGNTYYDRYKATVSGSTVTWAKEYRLNNSSFTAEQWNAIGSGITSETKVIHTSNTAVGSGTQPVYVAANGSVTATSYALNKTVPSDAVFTDTVTTATTSGSGNAVTSVTASNGALTVTKGTTFLTSHQSASDVNGTSVGSATQGTYINSSGKPTAMAYSVNKTVPSDAVFTDTVASESTFTFASNSTASQDFTISGVTDTTIGIVAVAKTANEAQYKAAAKAQLRCTAQSANTITITAYGTNPTVENGIPCVLTILKY